MAIKHSIRGEMMVATAAMLLSGAAAATCWQEAASMHGVPVEMLQTIAKHESGMRADAINKNTNGTTDIGLMQINSGWLDTLAMYGVRREDLNDACTNLKVGAWIMSNNIRRHGWNWNAVGAYNVGCAKLSKDECERRRNKYSWQIVAAMKKLNSPAAQAKSAKSIQLAANSAPARVPAIAMITLGDEGVAAKAQARMADTVEASDGPVAGGNFWNGGAGEANEG